MLCTRSFTFCIFASVVTLFNKDSKCVFHMADMAVGSLAPLTVVALGKPFLYVLDTFFQKLVGYWHILYYNSNNQVDTFLNLNQLIYLIK